MSQKLLEGPHMHHLARERLGIHHKVLEAAAAAVKKGIWSTELYPTAITP